MNQISKYLLLIAISFITIPSVIKADVGKVRDSLETASQSVINPADSVDSKILLARLDEINAMDKSILNRSERKALRKEVKSTKKQLSENHGGIYLSVGAVIIILLLLIILL